MSNLNKLINEHDQFLTNIKNNPNCSDPIKLDLIIGVVIYCPDIFMPRNA